jgi:hypothetical protein
MTNTQQTEAFIEKILHSTRGAFEIFGMYLGVKLRYYRALTESGAANSQELAERTGTYERYAREWLEQQAICGIIQVDDENIDAKSRRYTLPDPYREVLVDEESVNYLGALPIIFSPALYTRFTLSYRRIRPARVLPMASTAPIWSRARRE